MNALLQHASTVYTVAYFGAIILASMLEWAIPNRPAGDTVRLRWLSNFGISIVNAVLLRLLFPMLGVGLAVFCSARGWGLFNHFAAPAWLAFVLSLTALDVVYYAHHYLLHRVPLLWRLHRTHHTDQEYDFTTGARSHPFETMFTNTVIFMTILALGAPPLAVFVNQVLSIALAFVGHANVRLPASWDRVLRLVVVTPDMHRIHHSQDVREGESNFSNLFPWWDRLFATYLDQPAAGPAHMTFGVTGFGERKHLTLPWMLAQPFLRPERQADDGARGISPP